MICHGDAATYNTVFREQLPVAFIDFDTATPALDCGTSPIPPIASSRCTPRTKWNTPCRFRRQSDAFPCSPTPTACPQRSGPSYRPRRRRG
ncbi:hypothetical protein [Wenjunlia tyrosinilytica]|uniref:hypothetical protein n=1 Tax=Wenjunlia tyrosinilytica TaxID=1544741 RepID=UPI001E2FF031|nr:hypothetical protein [Wenjunlia tyrosinilytica]